LNLRPLSAGRKFPRISPISTTEAAAMDSIVFYSQFALSLLVYFLLAEWFLIPKLAELSQSQALLLLLIPQAFRHFGLFGLTQAAFAPFLPYAWATPVAIGDMITQISAVIAMLALRKGGSAGITWTWITTIAGTVDFLYSTYLTESLHLPVHLLSAAWFLPTFFFPLLVLGHWYAYRLLIRGSFGRAATLSSLR
jgi:hypothetical protein